MAARRVIVTRPLAQGQAWVEALRTAGVPAQALPLIEIAPPIDDKPVIAAWQRLAGTALVMFVSANAVQHFFALRPSGQGWPEGVFAGSTGPGTSTALVQAGVPVSCIVDPLPGAALDTESLWTRLQGQVWQGRQVLVVRGEDGRDWLADRLRRAGAEVRAVAAYRRLAPSPGPAERALLSAAVAEPAAHCWLFSSSESIARLAELMPGVDWSTSCALSTHPRIGQSARDAGFGDVRAVEPTLEALVRAVTDLPAAVRVP